MKTIITIILAWLFASLFGRPIASLFRKKSQNVPGKLYWIAAIPFVISVSILAILHEKLGFSERIDGNDIGI